MLIQNLNKNTVEILANKWPEGSALTEKFEFIDAPTVLEQTVSWITCFEFNAHSPEYLRAVDALDKTQSLVTKAILHTLISENSLELCKKAVTNFNAFATQWPKKGRQAIDIDLIAQHAQTHAKLNPMSTPEKVEAIYESLVNQQKR